MALFKRNRTSRLRATRAYLLIILGCTLLLFCFSIISFNEQHEKAQELSSSNLRLFGERVASDIERRMELLAADCLSKRNLDSISYLPGQDQSLDKLRTYREHFDALEKAYPIADHFFIFEQNQLVFPRLSNPIRQTIDDLTSPGDSPNLKRYMGLFAEGDQSELQPGQTDRAIQAFQSAEKLDLDARLKALAAFRTGRALQRAGRQKSAVEVFQRLIRQYGNQYDESQSPYILSLAASSDELVQKAFSPDLFPLSDVYRDLIKGKWELSAAQVAYYRSLLEQRLKLPAADAASSHYLDHFQTAKAFSPQLTNEPQPRPFEIVARSFEYGDKPYQTFRVSIPGENGRNFVVGFSVSMTWITDSLVSNYARDTQNGDVKAVTLVNASELGDQILPDKSTYVSFGNVLPFWRLNISTKALHLSELGANRELWFVGLSVLMFLCVLALALILFIRVSWDIRWFQLRSDFISGVTHEFKTPLSLIRLYSETLANDDQEFSVEDRLNYIRIVARESERLSLLIDNVLDFSKMEQNRRPHELQDGDLAAVVTQTVKDYSEYLAWRGFTVESSIPTQLPPVRFSQYQASQMILNLMDNARKYSGTSTLIRVNVWTQGNEAVVEVHDHGLGIPADEREKIFQPFYRASKGSEKGGCGLGLYLVDQEIKALGGRIEVESEVNHGSKFRLFFPISGVEMTGIAPGKKRKSATVHTGNQIQG